MTPPFRLVLDSSVGRALGCYPSGRRFESSSGSCKTVAWSVLLKGCGLTGKAAVSKTEECGFEPRHPCALVAQLAERMTENREARGSSPRVGTSVRGFRTEEEYFGGQ